jgi:hypothetical protein
MKTRESKQINPWLSIWTKTRLTMREILETNPNRAIIILSILNGVASSLVWLATLWSKFPAREDYRKGLFIVALLVVGALLGLIGLYLFGWIYKVVGRWIKGTGTYTEVKSAVGWSAYPFLIASLLNFLGILTLLRYPMISLLFATLYLVVLVWGIIISLKLLAEAHEFSAWRALGTLVLTLLLFFILFLVVALLLPLLSPLFDG